MNWLKNLAKKGYSDKQGSKDGQDGLGTMNAISVANFGGSKELKFVKEIPIPLPEETQVLIKVFSVGVNPLDAIIRAGDFAILPPLPYTPGCDCSGIVREVGVRVSKFKRGDRVFIVGTESGAYAEFAVGEEAHTFALPEKLTFQQGAALGLPYFVAYKALILKGHGKPGETVLIHGASGGVGMAATQIARSYGMKVFGTAGSDEGSELVRINGAHHVFDHLDDLYLDKVLEATKGLGVDMILELQTERNLHKDFSVLAKGGRIMVVGCKGEIQIDPRLCVAKEATVQGVSILSSSGEEFQLIGHAVRAGIESGWIKPVIAKNYKLQDAGKAHEEIVEHKNGAKGKIVLNVG